MAVMDQRGAVRRRPGFSRLSLRFLVCCHLGASYRAARDEAVDGALRDARRSGNRLVSIADLHGDFLQTTEVLVAAGLIECLKDDDKHYSEKYMAAQNWRWTAENATLVQLGDMVDRGDDAKQIYELLFHLQEEAPKLGGKVVILLGNHEVMNIQMDWRYVSLGDLQQFDSQTWNAADVSDKYHDIWNKARDIVPITDWAGRRTRAERSAAANGRLSPESEIRRAVTLRINEWSNNGTLGRKLRELPVLHKEGNVLFVHAGLHPNLLKQSSLGNKLKQTRTIEDLNKIMHSALQDLRTTSEEGKMIIGNYGPVWTRYLTQEGMYYVDFDYQEDDTCATVNEMLKLVGVQRIVVGHTPQWVVENNEIAGGYVNSICENRVVLSDTGLSYAYGGWKVFLEHDRQGGAEAFYPDTKMWQTVRLEITRGDLSQESITSDLERNGVKNWGQGKNWKQSLPKPEHLPGLNEMGADIDIDDPEIHEDETVMTDDLLTDDDPEGNHSIQKHMPI